MAVELLREWVQSKLRGSNVAPDWGRHADSINARLKSLEFAQNEESFTFNLSERGDNGGEWITEVAIRVADGATRLASRLSVKQPRSSSQPLPRAPRFIGDIARNIGIIDVEVLESSPKLVTTGNVDSLVRLLSSPKRSLPVLAISEDAQTGTSVDVADPSKFARYFNGIAHVVVLDPGASWAVTQKLGKERSTFQGAVRCYSTGFSPSGDPYKEKLWLRESIRRSEAFEKDGFLNSCLRHVFAEITAQFAPYPLLTPSAVKRTVVVASPEAVQTVIDLALDEAPVTIIDLPHDEISSGTGKPEQGTETIAITSEIEVAMVERALRSEIARLEEQLVQAQDETAQKNKELNRVLPFEQQVSELQTDLKILRGEYEDKSLPVIGDFFAGFNMFFESAQNLAHQLQRTRKEVEELGSLRATLEEAEQDLNDAKFRLQGKERQIASLLDASSERPHAAIVLYPDSWQVLVSSLTATYGHLTFSNKIIDQLMPTPFHESLARGVCDLLTVLDKLAAATLGDGSLDADGMEIHRLHFAGGNTAFSDESSTNKRDFEKQLTFPDPDDQDRSLFCPWHGKLSNKQFRVHFEWPSPEGQKRIKVVYIGPKITKH